MKHIIVFLAYDDIEIVKTSFNSLKNPNSDFFIVENWSDNSDKIKEFFLSENIKGYIQFEENARANAMNIFIRDFFDLLKNYEYVTMTDGDLYSYDIKETLNEILLAFENKDCYVCGGGLYQGNNYTSPNRIIGIEPYKESMSKQTNTPAPIRERTGNHLLTFNQKSLSLLTDVHYIDTQIFKKINQYGSWYKTTKNLLYHLTWDLYFDGQPYYENKKNNLQEIWAYSQKDYKYRKII